MRFARRLFRWWNELHTGVPNPCEPGWHVLTPAVDHGSGLRTRRCTKCGSTLIAPPEPPPGE